ncbi:MAG: hypothetical protein EKK53_07380 [Burkholderiales bacterium]|nr:MAG: hypothetical protein EKK53_07380 [Burkholderiales bacterium]
MSLRGLAGLSAALVLAAGSARAQSSVDRITWLAGDTAAASGSGARPSDRLLDWLTARLPGITHERIVANAKRSWTLIERGDPVCHASAVRSPQREALAYFSNTWPMPPLQLIVRRERAAALPVDAAGQVDLPALLADPRLQGVIVHGRSYGAALDAALAQADGASSRMRRVTAGDFGSNLVPMLLQARADYAFEYPNALAALLRSRPEVVGLAALPIKGVVEPVVSGVACPRTPWGQTAIRRIDAALGTPEGAALLRDILMTELPPDTRRQYREAFDAFFQRRSQPTPGL